MFTKAILKKGTLGQSRHKFTNKCYPRGVVVTIRLQFEASYGLYSFDIDVSRPNNLYSSLFFHAVLPISVTASVKPSTVPFLVSLLTTTLKKEPLSPFA